MGAAASSCWRSTRSRCQGASPPPTGCGTARSSPFGWADGVGAGGQAMEIQSDRWRVGVLPGTGASLAYGKVRTADGAWRDLLRPTRAAALTKPLWCASYVLVPFSNRVLGGLLRFGDRTWQLRCSSGDGHAMHGTGFEYAWEVAEQSDAAVSLVLDTGGLVGANFPWSFRAEVRYAVDGPRLTIGTRLTNTADEPFPAGFGHHPFFQRGLVDPAVAEVRLQVPAEGAYPMRDSIPLGPAGAVPARADYREIRVLDDVYVNDCLTRAPGSAPIRMEWPTSGAVSYTHLRAHETRHDLVCRLLLEKKKKKPERMIFISTLPKSEDSNYIIDMKS